MNALPRLLDLFSLLGEEKNLRCLVGEYVRFYNSGPAASPWAPQYNGHQVVRACPSKRFGPGFLARPWARGLRLYSAAYHRRDDSLRGGWNCLFAF